MKRSKSFADIVAEVKAEPVRKQQVRPGGFNSADELFDPAGHQLHRVRMTITPGEARQYVREGAQLAWDRCGCGGWYGCLPILWVEGDIRRTLGDGPKPSFSRKPNASAWIDLWQGDGGFVVYAHGQVIWPAAWDYRTAPEGCI